jgi:hypothetical protein
MRRYRLNATTFLDGFTMLSTNLVKRLEGVALLLPVLLDTIGPPNALKRVAKAALGVIRANTCA